MSDNFNIYKIRLIKSLIKIVDNSDITEENFLKKISIDFFLLRSGKKGILILIFNKPHF